MEPNKTQLLRFRDSVTLFHFGIDTWVSIIKARPTGYVNKKFDASSVYINVTPGIKSLVRWAGAERKYIQVMCPDKTTCWVYEKDFVPA